MMRVVLLAMTVAIAPMAASAAEQTFGKGDVVFRKQLKEPMPNMFGTPDIFGRKRVIGTIEVRFLGVTGSVAHFGRRDVKIQTNENTMNVGGTAFARRMQGNEETTVMVAGAGPTAVVKALAPDEYAVDIDIAADPLLIVDGTTLKVTQAAANHVTIDMPEKPVR